MFHAGWRWNILVFCGSKDQQLLVFDRLVVLQRKVNDLGAFSVGAMDSLAAVAKMGLGFAFRHTGGIGTFRPSIAIAVERHARDTFAQANLPKMTGAPAFS